MKYLELEPDDNIDKSGIQENSIFSDDVYYDETDTKKKNRMLKLKVYVTEG